MEIEKILQDRLGHVPKYRVRNDANPKAANTEDRLAACFDWFDPGPGRWRSLGSGRLCPMPPTFDGCYLKSVKSEPIPKSNGG